MSYKKVCGLLGCIQKPNKKSETKQPYQFNHDTSLSVRFRTIGPQAPDTPPKDRSIAHLVPQPNRINLIVDDSFGHRTFYRSW